MLLLEIFILLINVYYVLKFKSVLLQLVLLVSMFPLITMIAFMNEFPVPGILSLNRNVFSDKSIFTGFILLVLTNFILVRVLYPLRKISYYYIPFKCTNTSYYLLLILLFFSAVISYPRVFGINFEIDMSTIYISTNIALLLCKKERTCWCSMLHAFILLLVIIGGDRVDSIVSIIFLFIMNKKEDVVTESIKKIYFICGGCLLFVLSVISGIIRDGNSISIETIFYSLYAQQTVSDVLYVFLCSISYYYENGINLSVIGNLLFGLFPGPFYGVVSDYNYTILLLKKFMPNPGGGLFFSEGMIALGPIGVLLYMLVYSICIRILFTNKKRIFVALFILSFAMLCRIQWYGFIYAYKPIIFTLLFYFIFIHNIQESNTKREACDRLPK